jgi:hypothetical protein
MCSKYQQLAETIQSGRDMRFVDQIGSGRKAVISKADDTEVILSAIKSNRQRMRTAKAQWEAESGKKVCATTFKAFLKTLVEDINA